MKWLDAVKGWFNAGAEGSFRGPAVGYSHWGNPFPVSFGDGFQDGLTLSRGGANNVPVAYACVMATARAVSTCYPKHVRVTNGKEEMVTTSAASRTLRNPNPYQTWPQFMLNVVASMLFDGEAFVQLSRNDRYEVTRFDLLPRGSCMPNVEQSTGAVFYFIGTNPMNPAEVQMVAPARDVMHLRAYTPRHPLIGESPLTAAALAMGTNIALSAGQAAFFNNMARPSGILSTEATLTREQMLQLRAAFDEQSAAMNSGKIPVLSNGLKWQPLSITSQDAQLVEAQRLSIEEIARVFGVPLPVIGDLTKSTFNNTETIINFWLSTGLGSMLENIERSLDRAFNLPAGEFIELDAKALLRMDFKGQVEALTKAVQGGLMSPNEARAEINQPPTDGGDDVFLQQQMISIDMLAEFNAASIKSKTAPPPAPIVAPAEPEDDTGEDEGKSIVIEMLKQKRAA